MAHRDRDKRCGQDRANEDPTEERPLSRTVCRSPGGWVAREVERESGPPDLARQLLHEPRLACLSKFGLAQSGGSALACLSKFGTRRELDPQFPRRE